MRRRSDLLRSIPIGLVACGLALMLTNQTHAKEFVQIHRFEGADVQALATSLVRQRLREGTLPPERWNGRLLDLVEVAEIAPFGDRPVLLFLQMATGDECGTAGCETFIYRETPKGFVRICEAMMAEDIFILDAKENGYYPIDAGETIIHWSKQKDKQGDLCSEVPKPGYQ